MVVEPAEVVVVVDVVEVVEVEVVEVEVEVVVVEVVVGMGVPLRRMGVPVRHGIDPPQAAPGSGVPSQVQVLSCTCGVPMAA